MPLLGSSLRSSFAPESAFTHSRAGDGWEVQQRTEPGVVGPVRSPPDAVDLRVNDVVNEWMRRASESPQGTHCRFGCWADVAKGLGGSNSCA
jgi:hypothetical protein